MQKFLVSGHMLGALSILFVMFLVIAIPISRRFVFKINHLAKDAYTKLILDVSTLLPVAALLWNLLVYCVSNTPASSWFVTAANAGVVAATTTTVPVTFAEAVAGAGESAVIYALIVVLCRLGASVWSDITK